MILKPIFGVVIVFSLLLQLKNCRYGVEHHDVDSKYEGAHLAAVNGQSLLKEKKTVEALRDYELARAELEHANVRGDRCEDTYINYGFVLNDIGVIHLAWALYGREPDPEQSAIDPATVWTGLNWNWPQSPAGCGGVLPALVSEQSQKLRALRQGDLRVLRQPGHNPEVRRTTG